MNEAYARRKEQWSRFNQWEASQPPIDWSFDRALVWMAGARDLALQSNPNWGSVEGSMEHCEYLVLIRKRLSRLDSHG